MKERWRPIVDYEGRYEILDLGRVRSSPKFTRASTKLLTLESSGTIQKHNRVKLFKDGAGRRCCAGRLILEAFVGPAPTAKHEQDHKNRKPLDDRLSNLRWATRRENSLNRSSVINSSSGGVVGVSRYRWNARRPWRAYTKEKHIGYFATKSEAAAAFAEFTRRTK